MLKEVKELGKLSSSISSSGTAHTSWPWLPNWPNKHNRAFFRMKQWPVVATEEESHKLEVHWSEASFVPTTNSRSAIIRTNTKSKSSPNPPPLVEQWWQRHQSLKRAYLNSSFLSGKCSQWTPNSRTHYRCQVGICWQSYLPSHQPRLNEKEMTVIEQELKCSKTKL